MRSNILCMRQKFLQVFVFFVCIKKYTNLTFVHTGLHKGDVCVCVCVCVCARARVEALTPTAGPVYHFLTNVSVSYHKTNNVTKVGTFMLDLYYLYRIRRLFNCYTFYVVILTFFHCWHRICAWVGLL